MADKTKTLEEGKMNVDVKGPKILFKIPVATELAAFSHVAIKTGYAALITKIIKQKSRTKIMYIANFSFCFLFIFRGDLSLILGLE